MKRPRVESFQAGSLWHVPEDHRSVHRHSWPPGPDADDWDQSGRRGSQTQKKTRRSRGVEGKWLCHICNYRFIEKSYLKRHLERVHKCYNHGL